jgi:hypothetical protein
MKLEDCRHELPCNCGSPLDETLHVLVDLLRRQHLAAHDVAGALPWRSLTDSERSRWTFEARMAASEGPAT